MLKCESLHSSNRRIALGFVPLMVILLIFGAYLSQTISPVSSSSTTSASATKQVLTTEKTFGYNDIPYAFTVGNFTIDMVNNATGGEYLAFVFAFNVATPDGKTMNVSFSAWAFPSPGDLDPSWALPSPENATVNYGNSANLLILWNGNDTGLYVSFLQFIEVPGSMPQN